jgi:hypothetical protein
MTKLALSAAAILFAAQFALAPAALAGAQQEKMKACNKEAKDKQLKGDERKTFMKECLSAKKEEAPAAKAEEKSAKTAQQEKMKVCNKEAGDKKLTGDERKKFMSTCLKG